MREIPLIHLFICFLTERLSRFGVAWILFQVLHPSLEVKQKNGNAVILTNVFGLGAISKKSSQSFSSLITWSFTSGDFVGYEQMAQLFFSSRQTSSLQAEVQSFNPI